MCSLKRRPEARCGVWRRRFHCILDATTHHDLEADAGQAEADQGRVEATSTSAPSRQRRVAVFGQAALGDMSPAEAESSCVARDSFAYREPAISGTIPVIGPPASRRCPAGPGNPPKTDTWATGLAALSRYAARHGTAAVPAGWVGETGFPLGNGCGTRRTARARMPAERAGALQALNRA